MSEPVLECVNPWELECVCGGSHMPCWPRPDTSCCPGLEPEDPTPEQTAQIERMLYVATEIIWRLSGKQFGGCPIKVRPCRSQCGDRLAYGYWSGNQFLPFIEAGVWYNSKCDRCPSYDCSCTELCEVSLPGPVAEIIEVKQDGVVIPPTGYRVDNATKLVRLGGESCWPTCQDMSLPDTEVGTFSVIYRRGSAVPQGGLWAAGLLACQLIKACNEPGECVLPANAQRIIRQGVTTELTPVLVKPDAFATGIPEVDVWLQSVNPYKDVSPPRVYSVDRMPPRTQTWPC